MENMFGLLKDVFNILYIYKTFRTFLLRIIYNYHHIQIAYTFFVFIKWKGQYNVLGLLQSWYL